MKLWSGKRKQLNELEPVDMGDYAAKAQDLVKKADKKLNSFGLFGFGSKYEDAAELYEKAANQFKLAKACEHLLEPSFQHSMSY